MLSLHALLMLSALLVLFALLVLRVLLMLLALLMLLVLSMSEGSEMLLLSLSACCCVSYTLREAASASVLLWTRVRVHVACVAACMWLAVTMLSE